MGFQARPSKAFVRRCRDQEKTGGTTRPDDIDQAAVFRKMRRTGLEAHPTKGCPYCWAESYFFLLFSFAGSACFDRLRVYDSYSLRYSGGTGTLRELFC